MTAQHPSRTEVFLAAVSCAIAGASMMACYLNPATGPSSAFGIVCLVGCSVAFTAAICLLSAAISSWEDDSTQTKEGQS